ncbi:MAG: shikimate dehydrogenase [Schleiferiaceae bacterium]
MKFSEFIKDPVSRAKHLMLIGHPVSHSVSPIMHNLALREYNLDISYVAVDVEIHELPSLIAHFNSDSFLGANITLPYKQTLFDAVDQHSDLANEMGVINCIQKTSHALIGHNTDSYGFIKPLQLKGYDHLDSALIFGFGGAAQAVIHGLEQLGCDTIYVVSRNIDKHENDSAINLISYDEWPEYAEEVEIIVNTTPLGMHPNIDASPVQEENSIYLRDSLCYDIVYNPRQTKFLEQAKNAGATCMDGLPMLIYQAARSFELWTGKLFPVQLVEEHLNHVFPAHISSPKKP